MSSQASKRAEERSSLAACDCVYVPPAPSFAVRKKPDAAEREGMPMTVSKLCYETQLIARPKDPGVCFTRWATGETWSKHAGKHDNIKPMCVCGEGRCF